MSKLGPTGKFPDGTLGPHDGGELNVGVAHDSKGLVHINYGKDVCWVAFPREQAIDFARTILRHAGVKKVEIEL